MRDAPKSVTAFHIRVKLGDSVDVEHLKQCRLHLEQTGTAQLFAHGLLQVVADWPPFAVLLVMFAVAGLLTQILSDAATTVLLGPIAVELAQSLDLPPTPFVVCTALGAVVAFLTPIGHHGNLLILGPGQYKFGDFVRIGLPLTVMAALVCAWMSRWLWLGGPMLPSLGG
jgi:di/tricarboxylate transporter